MDEVGEHAYQLNMVPCKLIGGNNHTHVFMHMHTDEHKPPASLSQYCKCYQLEVRLGCVLQLCRG